MVVALLVVERLHVLVGGSAGKRSGSLGVARGSLLEASLVCPGGGSSVRGTAVAAANSNTAVANSADQAGVHQSRGNDSGCNHSRCDHAGRDDARTNDTCTSDVTGSGSSQECRVSGTD